VATTERAGVCSRLAASRRSRRDPPARRHSAVATALHVYRIASDVFVFIRPARRRIRGYVVPPTGITDASYKSFGVKPVLFPIRASIFGPISSRSWNAKTTSGHPGRERIRCDPWDSRLIVQPIRNNAANTLRALAEPQWLTRLRLRKLSRSPETFRHARSAQQEHAAPELQRATLLLREFARKPLPLGSGGSPRSTGRLSPARSR
jgi:hypothetical protein